MFTGLVECLGELERVDAEGGNRRFRVLAPQLREGLAVGDSIAHNGVCLTVEALHPQGYEVVAVAQTLAVTNLGKLRSGDRLNLERALLPSTRMGGHWVQGHVDGIATVVRSLPRQGSTQWVLRLPKELVRYCIPKGSIALDGISLTLSEVEGNLVEVNIIPHTAKMTTIGTWRVGRTVNVEVDLLAKYVERLLAARA
ncbi:MAG TPA: riboflavin synthase [Fibrobacteria bacterium]|nr:riboflavin synthase [Fibrobacteria bacterium]HOX50181.1 riboflavin synthase [Fibrobacteria bacterium]